ncbi:hypothetical protein Nepgr_006251 [Nepenthes gracilis]|uniref:Peptidase A1 domain-containing protein n=1 Tax=Nepenthes gracilis TaxID=150966 RepID=A0AAD3S5A7_NEPGR|nr:hypothetical protein Nepgr_006251 [Nepenthes gracilis]
MATQMNRHHTWLFPCLLICFTSIEALHEGFTVDLIHRDSSISPLHNSSKTKWGRLADSFRRSTSRVDRFQQSSASPNDAKSSLIPAGGEYILNLSIGTPPTPFLGIADTGSDLTWTQCRPCEQCYKQQLPIFDPKQSSTFKTLPCESTACNSLGRTSCTDGLCSYVYAYGDGSHTYGELATETLTFDAATGSQKTSFAEVVIGCGHDNGGVFNDKGSGLIGLGGGHLSLVSQLGGSIGGKFSYCLVPFNEENSTSKMSFGTNALVSGHGVVSTPLTRKDPDTFYYLTLEAISIGNDTLSYKGSSLSSRALDSAEGNIIIDSGTTLTILPEEFYTDLEASLTRAIVAERVPDPHGVLQLCYRSDGDLEVPTITVLLTGAEIELKPINSFVRVQEDVVCFAMAPAKELAILGNLAQMNFLVGYDLEEEKVSFKPTDCTKYQ